MYSDKPFRWTQFLYSVSKATQFMLFLALLCFYGTAVVKAQLPDRQLITRSEIEQEADHIVEDLSEKIGILLQIPFEIDEGLWTVENMLRLIPNPALQIDVRELIDQVSAKGQTILMRTFPAIRTEDPRSAKGWKWTLIDRDLSDVFTCVILQTVEGGFLGTEARKALLAHELFHCYQMQFVGPKRFWELPAWIGEGTAEWVGMEYAEGPDINPTPWQEYLTENRPLFERDYDAIGFFAHAVNAGIDLWHKLPDVIRGMGKLSFDFLARIGGDKFLQTWAPGLVRRPDLGADWDTDGPGITPDSRAITLAIVDETSPLILDIEPGRQTHLDIFFPEGKVLHFKALGYGELKFAHTVDPAGRTEIISKSLSKQFCREGTCQCESGNSMSNVTQVSLNNALLALTATLRPASIRLWVADPVCCPATANGKEFDPFLAGTWKMSDESLIQAHFGGPASRGQLTHSGNVFVDFTENGQFIKLYDKVNLNYLKRETFGPITKEKENTTTGYTGYVAGCARTENSPTGLNFITISNLQDKVVKKTSGHREGRAVNSVSKGVPWNQWPKLTSRGKISYSLRGNVLTIGKRKFFRTGMSIGED